MFFYFFYQIFLQFILNSRTLSYLRLKKRKILRKLVDKMKPKSNYKSIDLFAGIGSIRLGFEQAFSDDIENVFVS